MNSRSRTLTVALAITIILALGSVSLALVNKTTTWNGPNGSILTGSQSYWWDTPNFGYNSIQSYSQVSGQYQPLMNMFSDARAADRCYNANGTPQAWHDYAYQAKNAFGSYIQTAIASGVYQNCVYGHDYQWSSLHVFWYGSYNSGNKWVVEF